MLETVSRQDAQVDERPSQQQTIKTIPCSICEAIYSPNKTDHPPQSASITLEAVLMSMSHFCFRCRRPSCPECWDAVHGVCGSCVQESELPFRTELAPLYGVTFPPATPMPPPVDNALPFQLTCVKHGRFQNVSTTTLAAPLQNSNTARVERSAPVHIIPSTEAQKQEPSSPQEVTLDENSIASSRSRQILHLIEQILTNLVLLVLFAIIFFIIIAEISPSANEQIVRLSNIDIRAEIAYIIQLIKLLH